MSRSGAGCYLANAMGIYDDRTETRRSLEPPSPSEADLVEALGEIEQASQDFPAKSTEISSNSPLHSSSSALTIVCVALLVAAIVGAGWGARRLAKTYFTSRSAPNHAIVNHRATDAALQTEVEQLLQRVAEGDVSAARQVVGHAESWTGRTARTAKTDQFTTTALNLQDPDARAAALEAQLALSGVPRNQSGLEMLEQRVGNPTERAGALWLLGALGNRGVDPSQTAKIVQAYLNDTDVSVRTNAVIGLALLGTDETLPTLLDRFRNDPSPAVQDMAACGIAESGMYTRAQRLTTVPMLAGWLDDSLLSQQQRNWSAQALHDITGQNYGTDSQAWRRWYESTR